MSRVGKEKKRDYRIPVLLLTLLGVFVIDRALKILELSKGCLDT